MPPKKKPKSKKNKKQTIVTQWDDLDFQSLEQEISKLTKSHNLALQERIKIQTEHDAVRSYYNVTKQQIDSIDEQNKLKDYELDQKKRDDLDENKAYEEKVQRLRYDFEGKVRLAEENKRNDISIENKIYERNIQHGENSISSAKQELRERQVVNMEEIKQQKLQLEEGRGEVQTSLKRDLEELEEKCNLQEAKIEKELDLKREKDLIEMDDQIKLHLDELKRRHEELHKNTQTLYSNTSTENARSITKLEEECKHVSQSTQELEAKSKNLEEENNRLSGPLSELSSKVNLIKKQIKDKDKNRQSMLNVRSRKIVAEDRLKQQEDANSKLQTKYNEMKDECDRLRKELDAMKSTNKMKRINIDSITASMEEAKNFSQRIINANEASVVTRNVQSNNDSSSTESQQTRELEEIAMGAQRSFNKALWRLKAEVKSMELKHQISNRDVAI